MGRDRRPPVRRVRHAWWFKAPAEVLAQARSLANATADVTRARAVLLNHPYARAAKQGVLFKRAMEQGKAGRECATIAFVAEAPGSVSSPGVMGRLSLRMLESCAECGENGVKHLVTHAQHLVEAAEARERWPRRLVTLREVRVTSMAPGACRLRHNDGSEGSLATVIYVLRGKAKVGFHQLSEFEDVKAGEGWVIAGKRRLRDCEHEVQRVSSKSCRLSVAVQFQLTVAR